MGTKLVSFEDQLKYGQEFEDECARFLIKKGYFVIPKYLFAADGAPTLIGESHSYSLPDIDASINGKRIWVECKRKKRMLHHPATGFPVRHYEHYKKIQEITGAQVFVLFQDETSEPIYYGNWLNKLEDHIYKTNWFFDGNEHVTFRFPDAFIAINVV